jgi:hypothetical protein
MIVQLKTLAGSRGERTQMPQFHLIEDQSEHLKACYVSNLLGSLSDTRRRKGA